MEATMYGYPNTMPPFMMANPMQQPQVIYIPAGYPPMPPAPPAVPLKPGKPMSAKKIAKIAADWNKLLEEARKAGGKKEDDKKDKNVTEKMFTFFETCLLLIVTSIPVGLAMLFMLKTALSILRSMVL